MHENFNEKDALRLIDSMIASTRKDITENGFNLLLWGWLMLLASLSHFYIEQLDNPPIPSAITWAICSIAGGIITTVHNRREKKNARMVSYLNEYVGYLWQGFGLTMFVALFVTIARSPYAIFPVSLALMGMGTFVTGKIIRYKWLVYGGYSSWVLALLAFSLTYDQQILMYSLGMLISYIIPGYLLRRDYQRAQTLKTTPANL